MFGLMWRTTGASDTAEVLADEFKAIHGIPPAVYSKKVADKGVYVGGPDAGKPKDPDTDAPEMMEALISDFHAIGQRTALCLSGGGIRSAAFGLGVIQWLAKARMLNRFQYMSTVSGGGYIGAWLSTWIAKERGGFGAVERKLAWDRTLQSEPQELKHLRENATFLTQRTGPLSGDTWTAIAISLRNLALNWLVIIPPVVAAVVLLQALIAAVAMALARPSYETTWWCAVAALASYAIAMQYGALARPRWATLSGTRRMFGWLCLLPLLAAATSWVFIVSSSPTLDPQTKWNYLPGTASAYLAAVLALHACTWLIGVSVWWWIPGRIRVFVSAGRRVDGAHDGGAPNDQTDGARLVYTVRLSRKSKEEVTVEALTEDRQAVAGIHYDEGTQVLRFLPGATTLTVHVRLRERLIADSEIDARDVRLLLRNAKGAQIGKTPAMLDRLVELVTVLVAAAVTAVALSVLHVQFAASDHRGVLAIACLALPAALLAHMGGAMTFVGLSSRWARSEEDREWRGRADGILLGCVVVWIFSVLVVLYLPTVAFETEWLRGAIVFGIRRGPALLGFAGVVSGVAGALIGRGADTPAGRAPSMTRWTSRLALPIACFVFIVCLLAVLSLAADECVLGSPLYAVLEGLLKTPYEGVALSPRLAWLLPSPHGGTPTYPQVPAALFDIAGSLAVVCLALVLFATVAGLFVNVNRFSLHSMYRNRLVRTFLGGTLDRFGEESRRDRFTGFDESDNIEMQRLWDRDRKPLGDDWRPFHVVNMALNIVRGAGLSLKERRAVPFTVSPFWCGAAHLADGRGAFRRASEFGGAAKTITVGTAMAISGAAVSPNMGYHSSPLVTLLLALFNVRLGWWYGNPADPETYRLEGPRSALKPLFYEAFGMTDETRSYVYLSDGGHFENLGLYEMIRRRCHFIVLSDAGRDPECGLEELSAAVGKIHVDFGVQIRFRDLSAVRPRAKDRFVVPQGDGFAVGTIDYAAADGAGAREGVLLYVKPSFRGDEPVEVVGYAGEHPDFPHESTLDQWFTEAQFESYRALGFATMERALGTAAQRDPADVAALMNALRTTGTRATTAPVGEAAGTPGRRG